MTALADLCTSVDYGYTASASDDPSTGPKFLRITDIVPEFVDWTSVPHCAIEDKKREKFLLNSGDIVVARTGATVGYAKQIWARPEGATFASYLVRFRPDPSKVDPYYLGQVVQSAAFKTWVTSVAGGAAQPNANARLLGTFEVRLPEPQVQRKIGTALRAIEELIENSRRRRETLGEMARLLYREWFVHFRFPGHEEVEFVDSDLGTIPAGWQTMTLGAVANVNERSLRAGDPVGEILYLDISSVGPRTIEAPEAMKFSSAPGRARRLVAAGDTVWSTVRPNRRSHALLVDPPPNLVCSTGFAVLTPRTVPSSYLFELTSTDEFTAHLTGLATGSAYPAVRPADFECYPLALPPAELLDQYDTVVGPMHRLQHTLSEQNRVLSAARDLLLPQLIAGELDVSDLDLDLEPVA